MSKYKTIPFVILTDGYAFSKVSIKKSTCATNLQIQHEALMDPYQCYRGKINSMRGFRVSKH